MNHPEEAALLTSVLDRHLHHLTKSTSPSDWQIYWSLLPFLALLSNEPVLAGILEDYSREVEAFAMQQDRKWSAILDDMTTLFNAIESSLNSLRSQVGESKWKDFRLGEFRSRLNDALGLRSNGKCYSKLLEHLKFWISFADGTSAIDFGAEALQNANERIDFLQRSAKMLLGQEEGFRNYHPGCAYTRLRKNVNHLDYVATEDGFSDCLKNAEADKIRTLIRDSALWADGSDRHPQPGVSRIQRDVRILHLALVTSLAKGRSRWATVRRFAARCETFDRQRLINSLGQLDKDNHERRKASTPEAFLTLELCRYLFDAGFNPLVDVNACGLRPDVLDATANPAIYVEAKQYTAISRGIVAKLRKDIAQATNTWSRLCNRWQVSEAFLVVFRRSGRPLVFDQNSLHVLGRRLYICCVDIADAKESGRRAHEPVTINLRSLVPDSSS
jgi:hypothetical protein